VEQPVTKTPRASPPLEVGLLPGAGAHPGEDRDHLARSGTGNGPVIVLSYNYSGAERVQQALAADTELACTAATGIIPICQAAAETWRRIDGQRSRQISRLGTSSIRSLVTAQVTTILAEAGRTRWCELATAAPSAAGTFLQVFPDTRVVSVHRSCPGVIRAAVQASPWGVQGAGLMPFLIAYPGNSVAALAAYWASSAEELLVFEDEAAPDVVHRVLYEDVMADPDETLTAVRTALQLGGAGGRGTASGDLPRPETAPSSSWAQVPQELIPEPLLQRISRLHARLAYQR
jgi:hypothetical protein